MSEPSPLESLARATQVLRQHGVELALIGGLAVSIRGEVRFTRDVDLAIAVDTDRDVERLVLEMSAMGYTPRAIVEQEAIGRIATVRLLGSDGVTIDLLAASSGIEHEVIASAEPVDVAPVGVIPVARAEELIALKVLSLSSRRPQDQLDLDGLLRINSDADLERVRALLDLVTARGFHRGEQLQAKLDAVLARRND
ncbi:MAG: nucleotidyl transferase AbiEii/AbiGii toxin family protein [Deltaproteobacteria bacterium]|nr:nucleotidyl transferase AbiEii/AbiGii toxin family protein [Nannocystaceae bacterium]